jgi:hypothetical protein
MLIFGLLMLLVAGSRLKDFDADILQKGKTHA